MTNKLDRSFAQSILSCCMDKLDFAKNYHDDLLVISYTELEEMILSFIKQEEKPEEVTQAMIEEDFKI
jgi:hypothetical protein